MNNKPTLKRTRSDAFDATTADLEIAGTRRMRLDYFNNKIEVKFYNQSSSSSSTSSSSHSELSVLAPMDIEMSETQEQPRRILKPRKKVLPYFNDEKENKKQSTSSKPVDMVSIMADKFNKMKLV